MPAPVPLIKPLQSGATAFRRLPLSRGAWLALGCGLFWLCILYVVPGRMGLDLTRKPPAAMRLGAAFESCWYDAKRHPAEKIQCAQDEQARQEAAEDRAYARLHAVLPAPGQARLEEIQARWLAPHDMKCHAPALAAGDWAAQAAAYCRVMQAAGHTYLLSTLLAQETPKETGSTP
jgi:uncharacterized protein YecT (DUF1311 family)